MRPHTISEEVVISGLRKKFYKGGCRDLLLHAGIIMFLQRFALDHLVPTVSSLRLTSVGSLFFTRWLLLFLLMGTTHIHQWTKTFLQVSLSSVTWRYCSWSEVWTSHFLTRRKQNFHRFNGF